MPTHLLLRGESLTGNAQESLAQASKFGCMVVEISDNQLTDELLDEIRKKRFSLILQYSFSDISGMEIALAKAGNARAVAINARVETPHLSHGESVELTKNLVNLATSASIPLYFETHAGSITQDLYRTSLLVTDVPDMRFTLDVAHYVNSEETAGPIARLASLVNPILERTEMIRGRIPNSDHTSQYTALWTETMRRWRIRKPVGSSLVFIPQSDDSADTSQRAATNTWAIAQSAWKASGAAGKTPAWPVD